MADLLAQNPGIIDQATVIPVTPFQRDESRVERSVPSHQFSKALESRQENRAQIEEMMRQRGDAAQAIAEIERQQRAEEAEISRRENDRLQAHLDASEKAMAEASSRVDQERRQRGSLGLRGYFDDKPTSSRILAGFAMALGATTGGNNDAADIVNKAIDRDFALQKSRIDDQNDRLAIARTGIKDADEARKSQLEGLTARKAAAYKAVADKYAELKSRMYGPQLARLESDKEYLAWIGKHDEETARLTDSLNAKHVTTTVSQRGITDSDAAKAANGPKPTEQQRDKTAFFESALPSLEVLMKTGGMSLDGAETIYQDSLNQKAAESSPTMNALARKLGISSTLSEKLSAKDRQTKVAYDRALDIANKYITGAGQTDAEFARRLQYNTVQPGDDAETIVQKTTGLIDMIYQHGRQGATPSAADSAIEKLRRKYPKEKSPGVGPRVRKLEVSPGNVIDVVDHGDGTFTPVDEGK